MEATAKQAFAFTDTILTKSTNAKRGSCDSSWILEGNKEKQLQILLN